MCSELLGHVGGCKNVEMQMTRCSEWLLPRQVAKILCVVAKGLLCSC